VAAMTRNYYYLSSGGFYLLGFFSTVIYSFFVISGYKGSASSSAAKLMVFCRVCIDPIFAAIIKYDSRLFVISVSEKFFRFSAVIARVVIYRKLGVFAFI